MRARFDARGVLRMPDVEAHVDLAGDDVGRAREHVELADRPDEPGTGERLGLDGEHDLGGSGQGVAAAVHRHRTGVSSLALQGERVPVLAGDRGHDSDGQPARFQHRPLLDVGLDVAEQVTSGPAILGDAGRVAPEFGDGLGQADASRVDQVQVRRRKVAGQRTAAEVRGAEPHPLLISERDHLDAKRQPVADVVQRLHRRDRHEDAEHAVVPAGAAHGVQVRAHQQRRAARRRGLVAATHVADVVTGRVHARLEDPASDQVLRRLHRG